MFYRAKAIHVGFFLKGGWDATRTRISMFFQQIFASHSLHFYNAYNFWHLIRLLENAKEN